MTAPSARRPGETRSFNQPCADGSALDNRGKLMQSPRMSVGKIRLHGQLDRTRRGADVKSARTHDDAIRALETLATAMAESVPARRLPVRASGPPASPHGRLPADAAAAGGQPSDVGRSGQHRARRRSPDPAAAAERRRRRARRPSALDAVGTIGIVRQMARGPQGLNVIVEGMARARVEQRHHRERHDPGEARARPRAGRSRASKSTPTSAAFRSSSIARSR